MSLEAVVGSEGDGGAWGGGAVRGSTVLSL